MREAWPTRLLRNVYGGEAALRGVADPPCRLCRHCQGPAWRTPPLSEGRSISASLRLPRWRPGHECERRAAASARSSGSTICPACRRPATEVTVAAKPDDLPRLAEWLGVDAVERFEGTVTPAPVCWRIASSTMPSCGRSGAGLRGFAGAGAKPVWSAISPGFCWSAPRRDPPRPSDEAKGGILTLAAGDDEVPEELDSPRFDLAAPLLEELSLAVDPYPRAAVWPSRPRRRPNRPSDKPLCRSQASEEGRVPEVLAPMPGNRLESQGRFGLAPRLVLPARSRTSQARPGRVEARFGRRASKGVDPPWRYPKEKPRRRGATCAGRIIAWRR